MRGIALILTVVGCAAAVFFSLAGGWSATPREIASGWVAGERVAREGESAPIANPDPELEHEAVVQMAPSRTEATPATARLELHVVDERGRGVAGIRLRVLREEELSHPSPHGRRDEYLAGVRTTQAQGLAVWESLEPGSGWYWAAESDFVEYEPWPSEKWSGVSGPFALKARETTRLTGRVSPPLSIVGQVLGLDSRPRPGARVTALRRGSDRRSVVRTGTADAEGRFLLDRLSVEPLRLECVVLDAPDTITLVTRDVVPETHGRLDVGVLRLAGRTLRVRLRAVDVGGRDVTAMATAEGVRSLPVQVEGCTGIPQRIPVPLGGSFRVIGFECQDLRIRIPEDPPRTSCAPGWTIAWSRSLLEVTGGMEGDAYLDVPVLRSTTIAFSASGIHRAGVPDQGGVAVLRVSLLPEEGNAHIDFEMRALLGLPFDNTHAVPPGRYQLQATCEDEGTFWTADQTVVVTGEADESIMIALTRVR